MSNGHVLNTIGHLFARKGVWALFCGIFASMVQKVIELRSFH